MNAIFIEVTNGAQNWGKFMLAQFDAQEWARRSAVAPGQSLIGGRGWTPEHLLVLDLQTGEGALFKPGGLASADLTKHRIWVCPMFEPFLAWLYEQPNPMDLPPFIDLPDAEFAFQGYRRPGPQEP
jgi:hypothetical protein